MRFIRSDGDGDGDDDMDDFMDEENYENYENYESIISQQNALEGFHLHILEQNLKAKILFESLKLCQKSFFWKFYSESKKLEKLKKLYDEFINLLEMKEEV
jgi:hypothetical protein